MSGNENCYCPCHNGHPPSSCLSARCVLEVQEMRELRALKPQPVEPLKPRKAVRRSPTVAYAA